MTYDKPETIAGFAQSKGITYPMLSDAGSKAIKAFGLVSGREGSSWYGFASPAIFVVNKAGKITHRFSTTDYTDRPETEAVLNALK